jgi:hypothetical protein
MSGLSGQTRSQVGGKTMAGADAEHHPASAGKAVPRPRLARLVAVLLLAASSHAAAASSYYLSPTGRDSANGRTPTQAWKSFEKAFSRMRAGDELTLLPGTYGEAAGTGYISDVGRRSAQVPSGTSAAPTVVRAQNPGSVRVIGALTIGRQFRKDSYIRISGITFEGGGALYNTRHVTLQFCGFHSTGHTGGAVFGIGTNDHAEGNSDNLIEDVWIWGNERVIAINYRGDRNIWRRVVVRGDGCSSPACSGGGNPNVGISVYESTNTSLQNVLVIDRILGGGSPYADFAVAQHTPGQPHGNNEWLGTLSLNAPDGGYYFEPDDVTLTPAHRLVNCVAWGSLGVGINAARSGANQIENCTVRSLGGDGIRVAPALAGTGGTVRNVIVAGAGRFGVNSAYPPSYAVVAGAAQDRYNQTTCTVGCKTADPTRDGDPPSLKYITRIEDGSALKGSSFQGADYGANIVFRYGVDGSHFGDPSYNTLTAIALWPWPGEDRIRQEMCTDSHVSRGFCAAATLTDYIWGTLGNQTPVFRENGSPRTASPGLAHPSQVGLTPSRSAPSPSTSPRQGRSRCGAEAHTAARPCACVLRGLSPLPHDTRVGTCAAATAATPLRAIRGRQRSIGPWS